MCLFIDLIFGFYSIKASHFNETKIYVKLDLKAANTTHKTAHIRETHVKKRIYITNSGFTI